mmetsp:Transcript_5544/g.17548  ORF Transcript_5544/g.17548 Transcript_5544/m.17548 type:complete len:227 (-) Transcript_5544:1836-2516(-)
MGRQDGHVVDAVADADVYLRRLGEGFGPSLGRFEFHRAARGRPALRRTHLFNPSRFEADAACDFALPKGPNRLGATDSRLGIRAQAVGVVRGRRGYLDYCPIFRPRALRRGVLRKGPAAPRLGRTDRRHRRAHVRLLGRRDERDATLSSRPKRLKLRPRVSSDAQRLGLPLRGWPRRVLGEREALWPRRFGRERVVELQGHAGQRHAALLRAGRGQVWLFEKGDEL